MAAAASKKQPAAAAASTAATVVDPKFEWLEMAGSYELRLSLPGFRKDDFRVQVDGAGRLTVRGARPAAAGLASLHKVFQLPSAASLDDIAGRFEAGVLTLTVPKRASSAPAPTSIEEVKRKQPSVAKETKPKEEEITEEDPLEKPVDEATCKAQEKKEEEAAKSRKQEQRKPAPAPTKQEEMAKPNATQAAAVAPTQKPAPKPEGASSSEKAKATAVPDNLAERVRRRGEEEHAKAAAATTAAMKAVAEQEKKATASCGSWKERVQAELKELTSMKWAEGVTDMKWADGMVEAARNNKEVAAVAVAAFSLGFLVSQKLFRK